MTSPSPPSGTRVQIQARGGSSGVARAQTWLRAELRETEKGRKNNLGRNRFSFVSFGLIAFLSSCWL